VATTVAGFFEDLSSQGCAEFSASAKTANRDGHLEPIDKQGSHDPGG